MRLSVWVRVEDALFLGERLVRLSVGLYKFL